MHRPAANINEVIKSFFIVEMENVEMAKLARRHFYIEDKEGQRRAILGDRKAEINVLTIPTVSGNI